MKRFISKLIFFAVPVILCAVALEITLRRIPNNYSFKHDYLQQHAEEIETLVLGSSHGLYNVNPALLQGHAFSAAHVSQSLKYDYFIFDKFASRLTSLKTVILPIHYRTLFFQMKHDPEHWRENYYAIYYECDYNILPTKHLEICTAPPLALVTQAFRYVGSKGEKDRVKASKTGFGLGFKPSSIPLDESGQWAAKRHTISDQRHLVHNVMLVEKLLKMCADMDVNVFFFSPPVCASYMKFLDKKQLETMQTQLTRLLAKYPNAQYHCFFEDNQFNENDFLDADHLTPDGAKRLTIIINDLIQTPTQR